jgi:bacterioferritin
MAANECLSDVKALRERARRHIEQGAVTPSYQANVQAVVKLLNEALRQRSFACCGTSATTTWQRG